MEIYNIGVNGFNSYLIIGEKKVLIDTVPNNCVAGFLQNMANHLNIFDLDYIIFSRTTPDATGGFSAILKENPNIEVFASVAGLKNLKEIVNTSFSEQVVKNEATLCLGEDNLEFLITPNLSWPDTFIACLQKEKAFFSGNLFCESPEKENFQKEFLKNALDRINPLCISKFYPAYGEASDINLYKDILSFEPEEKLAIIYATTSGATEELAKVVCLEALASDLSAVLINADTTTDEHILNTLNTCKYLAFATPTINHNASCRILSIISKINVQKNSGKNAFLFGSYGWSGEGVNIISTLLQNLKIKTFRKPYRCIFNPSAKNIEDLKSEVQNFLKEVRDNA